jgi:NTE family protein
VHAAPSVAGTPDGLRSSILAAVDPDTTFGVESHLPPEEETRSGIGLALSGGGFRAALFHLGALRRLNELGLLTRIGTFASASGGSIANAQLARHRIEHEDAWGEPGRPIERFEENLAVPLREFCGNDIRTSAVFARLLPWNWFKRDATIEALVERFAGLAGTHLLSELHGRPRFVFCATDLRFRRQWVFDTGRGHVGDDQAEFRPLGDHWTLARAAAASGCFPIAFAAMPVPDDAGHVPGVQLSDGGLVDNMAIEPAWSAHSTVLASDASPSFSDAPRWLGQLWLALRYPVIVLEQGVEVRKRWLVYRYVHGDLTGAYWGIASRPTSYGFDRDAYDPPLDVYSDELIREVISQIRIDYDAFSAAESAVLENHGYLLAEIAVRTHAATLVAGPWPPPQVPHREWMDDHRVRSALAGSEKTKLFGRKRR